MPAGLWPEIGQVWPAFLVLVVQGFTLALLARVESLIEVPIEAGALPEAAREWQATIDEIAADDDEVTEYVQALEEAQDTAGLPQASGDAIAREFEAYLRDQGPGGKDLTG